MKDVSVLLREFERNIASGEVFLAVSGENARLISQKLVAHIGGQSYGVLVVDLQHAYRSFRRRVGNVSEFTASDACKVAGISESNLAEWLGQADHSEGFGRRDSVEVNTMTLTNTFGLGVCATLRRQGVQPRSMKAVLRLFGFLPTECQLTPNNPTDVELSPALA